MRPEECPILVVNANPEFREVVSGILDLEGYPVYTATNGVEALEAIESLRRTGNPQHPPIVLLDIRLPVLDGREVARRLQERDIQVRIVVISIAIDARAWAVEIGADAYLPEGFEIDDLLSVIARLCHGTDDAAVRRHR